MSKKYGVFITSAINSIDNSVYTPEVRFDQTFKTIETVRAHIPNSVICLVESSINGLSNEDKAKLVDKVDYFFDFSKEAMLKQIAENPHKDTAQNLSELVTLIKAFTVIKNKKIFDGCDRILKISGRYWLTDNFDIYKHDQVNKFVFFKKTLSQFPFGLTRASLQYMTRTYSFDISLLESFIDYLKEMLDHMQDTINDKRYIDIEHLFCKFIPKKSIVELGRIGVAGNISKSGALIED